MLFVFVPYMICYFPLFSTLLFSFIFCYFHYFQWFSIIPGPLINLLTINIFAPAATIDRLNRGGKRSLKQKTQVIIAPTGTIDRPNRGGNALNRDRVGGSKDTHAHAAQLPPLPTSHFQRAPHNFDAPPIYLGWHRPSLMSVSPVSLSVSSTGWGLSPSSSTASSQKARGARNGAPGAFFFSSSREQNKKTVKEIECNSLGENNQNYHNKKLLSSSTTTKKKKRM